MVGWAVRAICVLSLALTVFGCASQNRPAQLLSGAGPVYPPAAREARIEGSVTLVYDIEADGRVTNLVVIASEPQGVFEQAALAAVRSWQFNPRVVEGRPVLTRRRQSTVTFRLSGTGAYDGF